jgi:hypothetical protein
MRLLLYIEIRFAEVYDKIPFFDKFPGNPNRVGNPVRVFNAPRRKIM